MVAAASGVLPAGGQAEPRSFTIAAAGDILIHGRVARTAQQPDGSYDFAPMFEPIEPWLSPADLAICHLEGTLTPTNSGLRFYPRFVGPHEVAQAIVGAGYDLCSTAGNHAMDAGWQGIVDTLDVLDEAGVHHDGTARSERESRAGLYRIGDPAVTVGHLSYTYGLNGLPRPEGRPWAVNVIDPDAILSDAEAARQSGAEFVVVSLHWGVERRVTPTSSQRSLARTLLESPHVDLILGSHAHVIQPVSQIAGKFVVYGMGNHLSNQNSAYGPDYHATEDGVVVIVTATEQPDGTFATTLSYAPTWVRLRDYAILSTQDALLRNDPEAHLIESSQLRTIERISRLDAPVGLAASPWPEVTCFGHRATIVGTPGDDILVGTPDDDVIVGRDGDDLILAGDGTDLVCGDAGDDHLAGGPGPGKVIGGVGEDMLSASSASVIMGGPGRDICHGGFHPAGCEG